MGGGKTLAQQLAEIKAANPSSLDFGPPELWSPELASTLSLFLGPAFGAYIHMRNWQRIGEAKRARACMLWFWGSVVSYEVVGLFSQLGRIDDSMPAIGVSYVILLLAWYFASARLQIRYFDEVLHNNYKRDGMLRIVFGAIALFMVVNGLIFAVLDAIGVPLR